MYNEGATYRMTTSATLNSLSKVYLWRVTHLDGDYLGCFTLTCLNNDVALTAQTNSHNIYNTESDAVTAILKGEGNWSVESFEGNDGYVTLTKKTDGIAANEGVIITGAFGKYTFTAADVTTDWSNNLLEGSVVDAYVSGSGYVLSAPEGMDVGLYRALLNKDENGAAATSHFKNNAGKAYLPASAVPSEARFLVFDFGGEETGIIETENGNVKAENNEVYDLAGRRVLGAQKGIFIVNGKIVVR